MSALWTLDRDSVESLRAAFTRDAHRSPLAHVETHHSNASKVSQKKPRSKLSVEHLPNKADMMPEGEEDTSYSSPRPAPATPIPTALVLQENSHRRGGNSLEKAGPEVITVRKNHQPLQAMASRHGRVTAVANIVFRVLTILLALSIISLLAYVTERYNSSKEDFVAANITQGQLGAAQTRVWTKNLRVYPVYIFFAAAGLALLESGVLLAVSVVPKLKGSGGARWATLGLVAVVWGVWIAALVYFKSYERGGKVEWDLWSWTCTKGFVTDKVDMNVMCKQLGAAWYAGLVVAILDFVTVGLIAWGIIESRRRLPKAEVTQV
ncbi:hypothetical protein QBC35DRAFT_550832 [Podospora australis]|uniref:Uncharacterized protein n=1 Tax=Podospora australis TaxID=1536484 RepID=A0AAN6WUH4_9PEZI|nr:hypothetical protein QBC35DRAFT_550832 [Podospora australis]